MQEAYNRRTAVRPLGFAATGDPTRGAQAHMSCNRRDGYQVRKNCTAACANATSSRGLHGSLKR
jgi:hypothetical protein